MSFAGMASRALGVKPWPWQARLAKGALPELIQVPTGCGKTAGVVLAWLFRRRFHDDPAVRAATPRRLVFVLPLRTLVEQTEDAVREWLRKLGLDGNDGVRIAVLMGGERPGSDWRFDAAADTIVIGTLDMVLSRTLNRGYGQSRYTWPVDFGLLNTDCAYVFDEVQLMGAARPTSRQLQAFREGWGTAARVTSTWMSATLDPVLLDTVDAPVTSTPFELGAADETKSLRDRLDAERRIGPWVKAPAAGDSAGARAAVVVREHRPGTLTLAVVNTIDAARELYVEIGKLGSDADRCLLHSRFRPADRAALLKRALSDPPTAGRIVCSTQVIEAGVDLSAATLFTEAAPWSSVVQRIGRCNRDGGTVGARVFWDTPARPEPYESDDVKAAAEQLDRLTGSTVTTRSLSAVEVTESGGAESQVVRRADLLRLFDTTADLSGNDLDIGPYIRDGEDLDVQLCWRPGVAEAPETQPPADRDELCPVGVVAVTKWRQGKTLYRVDHLARSKSRVWMRLAPGERVLPGQILLADAAYGGYTAELGWAPSSRATVVSGESASGSGLDHDDLRMRDDNGTKVGIWVTLEQHLSDVGAEVEALLRDLDYDLQQEFVESAVVAGRWHDWGKAHPVFQQRLLRAGSKNGEAEIDAQECPDLALLWAKSAAGTGGRGGADDRPYFRHELASALAVLIAPDDMIGSVANRDLVAYLVAAHHGKVRMALRAAPDESGPDGERRYALGVWDGDELPSVRADGAVAPACVLDLSPMDIGDPSSWVARASRLLSRGDLGPFRLGFLEAAVRVSDWRASARYERQESADG